MEDREGWRTDEDSEGSRSLLENVQKEAPILSDAFPQYDDDGGWRTEDLEKKNVALQITFHVR